MAKKIPAASPKKEHLKGIPARRKIPAASPKKEHIKGIPASARRVAYIYIYICTM